MNCYMIVLLVMDNTNIMTVSGRCTCLCNMILLSNKHIKQSNLLQDTLSIKPCPQLNNRKFFFNCLASDWSHDDSDRRK